MKGFPMEVGREVISRQGRDAGRHLLVVAVVDESFVLVADGALRKLEKPKKKKKMHLTATPAYYGNIADTLVRGLPLQNAQLRACLAKEEPGAVPPREGG